MTGTIKTKTTKGFGFITRDEGTPEEKAKELFFHSSELKGVTFDELQEGAKVTFEVEVGPKGPAAKNVQLVK